jgi:hypothetical protein
LSIGDVKIRFEVVRVGELTAIGQQVWDGEYGVQPLTIGQSAPDWFLFQDIIEDEVGLVYEGECDYLNEIRLKVSLAKWWRYACYLAYVTAL